MIAKVNAKQLNSLFADYIKSKKELFCFMFSKSIITVQYLSVYTAETSLSIITDNIKGDKFSITFYATKSILALNDNDILFDFKETTFIDSAGVGLVLGRYQQLVKEERKLSVCHLSKTAYKVFELSGLFEILDYIGEVKI